MYLKMAGRTDLFTFNNYILLLLLINHKYKIQTNQYLIVIVRKVHRSKEIKRAIFRYLKS